MEVILKPLSWSYVAGFFDGEGCISYAKRTYGKYIIVHVSQGYKNELASGVLADTLKFLVSHKIKARLSYYGDRGHETWLPTSRVLTSSSEASKTWLEYMLPFLRVKRQQAIDALEFITSIKHPNLSPGVIDTIKDQRDRNISIKKIAKSLGVSHSAVRYQLIKLGGYEPLERKKNTI